MLLVMRLLWMMALVALYVDTASAQMNAGSYQPAGAPAQTAQIVKVGFYPVSVYALDVNASTYYLDTYVWLRWKGEGDPTTTLEFTNMVEEWGKQQQTLLDEPTVQADGSKYQIMRIEGRFVQPFDLGNYPLDIQHLSVLMENTKSGDDIVVYQLDKQDSGVGEGVKIPGWNLLGWKAKELTHKYGTKFGAESGGEAATSFSVIEFALEVERPASFFFWKLLLPLLVVLCASWAVLLLDAKLTDVRTGMPTTALLTTVFLQQSYSSALPDIGYLVLIDKIYVVAYVLIVLTLLRTILVARFVDSGDPVKIQKANRSDRIVLVVQVTVFALSTALIVLTRGA